MPVPPVVAKLGDQSFGKERPNKFTHGLKKGQLSPLNKYIPK